MPEWLSQADHLVSTIIAVAGIAVVMWRQSVTLAKWRASVDTFITQERAVNSTSAEDLQELKEWRIRHDSANNLERIDQQFQLVFTRLKEVSEDMQNRMDEGFQVVNQRINDLKEDMDSRFSIVEGLRERVSANEQRLSRVEGELGRNGRRKFW